MPREVGHYLLLADISFQHSYVVTEIVNMSSAKKKTPPSDAASECLLALDHLRNALDLTPPRSASWYALFGLIGKLAAQIDASTGRGPGS